jgi:hypothetical protein
LRWVGVPPLGDPVEEAVQVDEAILDADPVQRLAGAQPVLGGQPGLEVLDVVAFEIGAGGDLRVIVDEPGAELAQGVLDMRYRRRPQTQRDLVDVAARHLRDAWRDRRPPADRDGRAGPGPGVSIEAPGVEQRELKSVEDGRHVPAGARRPARDERVDDSRPGLRELARANRLRWGPGERRDLGQRRPLQRRVGGAQPELLGERDEPGVGFG